MPSWNDNDTKQAILAFVEVVTDPGSSNFAPPAERIALADNDGTLWAEQPHYFQGLFTLDRVKALAPQHPEWKKEEPFASLLRGDMKAALAGGERALLEIVMPAARRCAAGDKEERARLLGIGVAAIEPFLGPDVPCGQSFQTELLRMQGELLLERDGLAAAGEALTCFQQAMQLGRDQGALGWELRGAMSLVRLREQQGEAFAAELAEARQCQCEVYGRFTEGFAFPDLQDAAALIGETG